MKTDAFMTLIDCSLVQITHTNNIAVFLFPMQSSRFCFSFLFSLSILSFYYQSTKKPILKRKKETPLCYMLQTNVSQTMSLLGALLVVYIFVPLHHSFIQPLAVVNAKHLHPLVVLQVWQKLGCDQEVLCRVGLACLF